MLLRLPLVLVLLAGCAAPSPPAASAAPALPVPTPAGVVVVDGEGTVEDATDRLIAVLGEAGPVEVLAVIDHTANAASVGLDLPPTRVVLFGNPRLGTPLMQADPRVGIDLPQKILLTEVDGQLLVAHNGADYLSLRYGLDAPDVLGTTADALARFSRIAAGDALAVVRSTPAGWVAEGEGLVMVPSPDDVPTTYGRLLAALRANDAVTVVAEVDHAANAASAGLDLRPTRLVVVGNPALGTPLMRAAWSIALDLPQTILVAEDAAGEAFVVYEDPAFLARRHGLGALPELGRIAGALAAFADAATAE